MPTLSESPTKADWTTIGNPKDTRTEWQRHSLRVLVRALLMDYPEAKVAGHRDLSPDLNNNGEVEPMEWTKQCPCFEVKKRSGNQEKGGDKA